MPFSRSVLDKLIGCTPFQSFVCGEQLSPVPFPDPCQLGVQPRELDLAGSGVTHPESLRDLLPRRDRNSIIIGHAVTGSPCHSRQIDSLSASCHTTRQSCATPAASDTISGTSGAVASAMWDLS